MSLDLFSSPDCLSPTDIDASLSNNIGSKGGGNGKKSLALLFSSQCIVSTSPKNVTVFLRSLLFIECDENSSQCGGGGGGKNDDVMWESTTRL